MKLLLYFNARLPSTGWCALIITLIVVSGWICPSSSAAQGVSWELQDDLDEDTPLPSPHDAVDQTEEKGLPPAELQSADKSPQAPILHPGISDTELLELLGEPDLMDKSRLDSVVWHYGKSLVFVSNGKVTAWTDSGDLESRARFGLDMRRPNRIYVRFGDKNWLDAWRKTPIPTRADVLDELAQ